jgi:AraC-like DNA-binding protein
MALSTFTFNLFNSIILAGVLQGFIFSLVVLINKRYKTTSTIFLVCLILVFSLSNLQFYVLDINLIETYAQFYKTIYLNWSLLIPTFLWLYAVSFIKPNFKFKSKYLLLFSLFIVSSVGLVAYKIMSYTGQSNAIIIGFAELLVAYGEYAAMLFNLAVVVYAYKVLSKTQNIYKKQWLQYALTAITLATVLWFVSVVFDENYYFLWILVSVIIYWLGHVGIYKYGILKEADQIHVLKHQSEKKEFKSKSKNKKIMAFEALVKGEKKYLDPLTSQRNIAENLDLSPEHLSTLINQELGKSFNTYINELRIEEVKMMLKNPEFDNYSLMAIGLESGFNSKSSFYASFKKHTGQTPSQYKQSL